jgi:protein disulfide-isomerase A1
MLASDKPAIILIHADWCGHCQRLMPAWDQMNAEIAKDATLANKIVFHKIESNELPVKLDDINALLPEEGKVVVQGYPTMGDVRNKRFTMYAGDRDPESLMRWVKTVAA